MESNEPAISNSDERLLRALATGEVITFDWVALQHLKQKGLVEETPAGPKITDAGRRAIGARPAPGH